MISFLTRGRSSRLPVKSMLLASAAVIGTMAHPAFAAINIGTANVPINPGISSFTARVTASGSATVSGNGSINLGTVFGASLGTQGFNLPQQTVPINLSGGVVNVSTNPTGNIVTSFVNNPAIIAASDIQSGNINLLGGSSVPINFDHVNVSIQTSIIGIPISLGLGLDVSAALTALNYHSSASSITPDPNGFPEDWSNPGPYILPGTFDLGGNIQATGSTSILGIGVSLGQLLNQSISQNGIDVFGGNFGGLPGVVTLGAIPTGTPGVDNLAANYTFPNLGISIPQTINQASSVDIPGQDKGSLGSLHSAHLNYSVNLTLTLSDISYNLNGGVAGAVVPEASTLLMSGVASLGMLGMGIRSIRRRMAS